MKTVYRNVIALTLAVLALNSAPGQPAPVGVFTLTQPMTSFRKNHTSTLLRNGKVLVGGGRPFAQAAVSELYDPATQTWTNSGPLNLGRVFHTATLLIDGRVVAA